MGNIPLVNSSAPADLMAALNNVINQVNNDGIGAVKAATTPPATGNQWLSTATQHAGIDPGGANRGLLLAGLIEPSVFYGADGQTIYAIFAGNAQQLYKCLPGADLMVASNWNAVGTIVGNGVGGIAGNAAHSGAFTDNGTVYLYFIDVSNDTVRCTYSPLASIETLGGWTLAPTTQMTLSTIPTQAGGWGNCWPIKIGSTYALYTDYLNASGGVKIYQIAVSTCTSPIGAFTKVAAPLTTLAPGIATTPYNNLAQFGGVWVGLDEDGVTYVLLYHGSPSMSAASLGTFTYPTQIYRATTTSPLTDSWTMDNNGLPIMRCQTASEIDQIADPCIFTTNSGVKYLFYEGGNNVPGSATFTGAVTPMIPKLMQHDGVKWRLAQAGHDSQPYTGRVYPWTARFQQCYASTFSQGSTLDAGNPIGTWTYDQTTSGQPMPRSYSDGGQNEAISFQVNLSPGTWRLNILCDTGPAQGKVNIYFSSYPRSSVSQIEGGLNANLVLDTYSSGTVQGALVTGTFTLPAIWNEPMPVTMTFLLVAKNASSTGYGLSWYGWALEKTTV